MNTLLIDNYDSFSYNLYQLVGELDPEILVIRNDEMTVDEIIALAPARIIISPGPGRPEDAGICVELIRRCRGHFPILGVCLGHQAICTAFGGKVVRSGHLMHGKTSEIRHNGTGIFAGLPSPFTATRYHSLVADKSTLPPELLVTAESLDDGFVMGVRHTKYPIEGVQFHPESILSHDGDALMRNFLFGPRTVGA